MMPISTSAISETLNNAFRAAFLLTGSADSAENAVLNGIAALESSDDVENSLVPKTVAFLIRQHADRTNRAEHAVTSLPVEHCRLFLLPLVSRECFLLRIIFGIAPANCAVILNLTIEEFEESLRAALDQCRWSLLTSARSVLCIKQTEHTHDG